ncbi:MAG: PAS domain S-box protein [Proteobacteria bacterium]|nr:PAS domain S-box protein [Pseudomonadota bacterium]
MYKFPKIGVFLAENSPYIAILIAIILVFFSLRVNHLEEQLFQESMINQTRIRGNLKTMVIAGKGGTLCLKGYITGDEDILDEGLDLLDSAIGFTDNALPFDNKSSGQDLLEQIKRVIQKAEDLKVLRFEKNQAFSVIESEQFSDQVNQLSSLVLSREFTYRMELAAKNSKILKSVTQSKMVLWVLYGFLFALVTGLVLYSRYRKRIEIALKESEEHYRLITEHSLHSIFVHCDGKVVYANPAGIKLLGAINESQLIGKPIMVFVHPEYRDFVAKRAKMIKEGETGCTLVEEKFIRLDGSVVEVEVGGQPFQYLGDPAVQVIVQDITDRKQAEAERVDLEKQLRQSQKMESMGVLAGGIAHEFNNLLTPILGYAAIFIDKLPEGSREQNALVQIQKAGVRAKKLIKQILAFSRISMFDKTPISVELVVKSTIKLLSQTIPSTITIRYSFESDLPKIMASSHEIQQVITNLCINASHAMPEGGYIDISTKSGIVGDDKNFVGKEIDGPFIVISIEDFGCGIDPSIMEHIFEPFYTTKIVGEGTGLGLSVAIGIAEQHNGHIRVESEVGKGTKFEICVPVVTADSKEPKPTRTTTLAKGTERILLVDDEVMVLEVVTEMLEHLGYQITPFTDCKKMLETLEKNPHDFDMVITDYTMLQMTGRKLVEKIKQIPVKLPIILLTGFSEEVTEDNTKRWDIDALLMKPLNIDELSKVIRNVFNSYQN